MAFLRMWLLCALVLILGCGQGETGTNANEPSLSNVKFGLQQIANGGSPDGSLMTGIEMGLENLKKTDPAQAESLQKDIADLKKLPPDQTAARAKQILDRLEPGK